MLLIDLNELIVDTLTGLGLDVAMDLYEGKKSKYIVFNYESEKGDMYADDKPLKNTVYVQIHLFMNFDEDYRQLKKKIRSRLFEVGFSYAKIALNVIEEDTKKRHICFRCEYVEDLESEVM